MDNRKTIYLDDAIDAIDKRVQFLKDDPVFRRKHGDIDLYGIKPIIRALPSAQPDQRRVDVENVLALLDGINSSGRMDYGDYCDLYDAIEDLLPV